MASTTALSLKHVTQYLLMTAWISSVVFGIFGSSLSLAAFGSAMRLSPDFEKNRIMRYDSFAAVGIALTVVGLFAASIYYAWTWPRRQIQNHDEDHSYHERPSPSRSIKQPLSHTLSALTPMPPHMFQTASRSSSPSPSRMSIKLSVGQAFRPMTSKTRLIMGASSSSLGSRSLASGIDVSTDAMRHHGDFDQWDTSSVETPYNTLYAQKPPRTRLEPIPGSRSHSPAQPLDGPFSNNAGDISPEDMPLPETPPHSPFADRRALPYISRPPTASTSHDESHIHPLFRSESPVPPPLRSPGTIITASPLAGQVMRADEAPRMLGSAQGSRPVSPNLPPMYWSRTESVTSFKTVPGSPVAVSPIEHDVERNSSRLSDTSPPAD